jgi:L-ascorbate metabolism protein UlaG (beta-lactamase superfamily)
MMEKARRAAGRLATAMLAAALLAACNPLARPSLNAYRPLETPGLPAAPKGQLTARFAGTSTLLLSDGTDAILIDGFFSRPSLLPMVLTPLRTDMGRVEDALRELGLDKAQPHRPTVRALFVAHAHHDHAMDSARVAELLEAPLVASKSTAIVLRDQGFKGVLKEPAGAAPVGYGRFKVAVIETPHAPKDFKPLRGEVTRSLRRTRFMWDYKASRSHAYYVEHEPSGRRILIVPSAGFERQGDNPFAGLEADAVFLSVAKVGLMKVACGQEYWSRTVKATAAGLVIAIHWDDIRRPLDRPVKTIPRLQDDFHRGMRILMPLALRDGVQLRLPKLYEPIGLDRLPPRQAATAQVMPRPVCPPRKAG